MVKGGEGARKEEEEEEEEEWKLEDANAEMRVLYNKNRWFLVAEWYDVDEQEARNRAAEIMIEDFNNAGGPVLEYGAPTERKIGPYGARNVVEWCLLFSIYTYDKGFLMGSFVPVQQYDAKKTPVVTNVLQCPFFPVM